MSLFHTLGLGTDGLMTSRQGVDTTSHNIANAQTEGYSRQELRLKQRYPFVQRNTIFGNGVSVGNIKRAHDKFLESQLIKAYQESGRSAMRYETMRQVEDLFNPEFASNIADEINRFFASLQNLSDYPDDLTVRSQVKESAINLTNVFRQNDRYLRELMAGFNQNISLELEGINAKLETIAELNQKILEMENGSKHQANDLRDERERLVRELAEKINVNVYNDKRGMLIIRGPKDVLMVEGQKSATFVAGLDPVEKDRYTILAYDFEKKVSRDVTESIHKGELAGILGTRDGTIRRLISENNEIVINFVEQFNKLHRLGYGINAFENQKGRHFFENIKNTKFAAQEFKLNNFIFNNPDAISTSATPYSAGDNIIVNELLKLKENKIISKNHETLINYYANYVGVLGTEILRIKHQKEADTLLKDDLVRRKASVSGVSLDEEAINMLRWQASFKAASKVIKTIDEMLDTVLDLKKN